LLGISTSKLPYAQVGYLQKKTLVTLQDGTEPASNEEAAHCNAPLVMDQLAAQEH